LKREFNVELEKFIDEKGVKKEKIYIITTLTHYMVSIQFPVVDAVIDIFL